MKKKSIILIIALLTLNTPIIANCLTPAYEKINVYKNMWDIKVNGNDSNADTILYNGNNYVKFRDIAEQLNMNIDYNSNQKVAWFNEAKNPEIDMSSATCKLYITLDNGGKWSGSAWFIDNKHLITASHVVTAGNGCKITKMQILVNGILQDVKLLGMEKAIDFALLETINYTSSKWFEYDKTNIIDNEMLISYSYPESQTTCLSELNISKEIVNSSYDGKMICCRALTYKNVSSGSSGGVVTRNNKAVGMILQIGYNTNDSSYKRIYIMGIHQIISNADYILNK